MKVWIVKSMCEEHGAEIVGVFSDEAVAKLCQSDNACPSEIIDYFEVQDTYLTFNERLVRDRIIDGRDPVTGR